MSQKAWLNAFTKGSVQLQDRLKKVHKNNPEFQNFLKTQGMDSTLSVKQSGLHQKSVATVKPVTQPSPEKNPGSREAMIKAAAEKIRDRRLAASNRVSFGGELGGGFSMPGGGFRRYSEALEESKIEDAIRAHPGVSYYGGKSDDHFVELHKGYEMDGQRSFGNPSAAEAKKMLKHVKKVQATDESVAANFRAVVPGLGKLQAKNRALDLDGELEQGILNKTLTRAQRMAKAKHIERFARVASGGNAFRKEDIAYKDGSIRMYKGGWIALRDGKKLGTTMPSDEHAKQLLDSTRKSIGRKTMDILKKKKFEIMRGLGHNAMATESVESRKGGRSWDSAVAKKTLKDRVMKALERKRINRTIDYIKNPKYSVLDKNTINRLLKGE